MAARAIEDGRVRSLVTEVSFFRASAPSSWQPGKAFSPTIGVVVAGRKQARVAEATHTYGPGDYFVLTGEMAYETRVVEASVEQPYLSVVLAIPSDLIVETALTLPTATAGGASEAYVARLDDRICDAIRRLVEAGDDPQDRINLAPLAMREVVFLLLRSDSAGALRSAARDNDDHRRVREAMAFIHAHFGLRLSVDRIAKHVGMSPSHFAHRFREIARVTPMRYLKTIRMQRAKVALLRGGGRPSEVAQEVGYSSSSHFTRDFKSYFGYPPAEFARRGATAGEPAPALGLE